MKMPHLIVWTVSLPLWIFGSLDVPLTKFMRYPYLSIGVVGVKR
jgi:hypothetical protein